MKNIIKNIINKFNNRHNNNEVTLRAGHFIYDKNVGRYGSFSFNNMDYQDLRVILTYEDLPEKDDTIVSVTPRTFEALCIIADAVEKLQLKDVA